MGGTIYFKYLKKLLDSAQNDLQLFTAIVDAPFHNKIVATHLDLGIVVFLLVNKTAGTIDRIALSNTEQARGAVKMSEKPFAAIKIPIGYEQNMIARAIQTGEPQVVTDWKYLFAPDLSARAARFNQAGAGIECSYIYPLKARDGGALIFSYFQESKNVTNRHQRFMEAYSKLVAEQLTAK